MCLLEYWNFAIWWIYKYIESIYEGGFINKFYK